ncbi:MAG: MFS transporter [Gammaproteobacteria bacterium]|nr:MFS transporter [Gammaproteobacteria bacterium]
MNTHFSVRPLKGSSLIVWGLIGSGIVAAVHIGKLPPALIVLQKDFAYSLKEAGLLLSIVQLVGMTLGLVLGFFVQYLGLRIGLLLGLAGLGVASFAGAFSSSGWMMLLSRVVEGMGFLLTVISIPPMIRHWAPPEKVHRLMGWWGGYMPIGTALAYFFGVLVVNRYNWQIWWQMSSGITWVYFIFILKLLPVHLSSQSTVLSVSGVNALRQTTRAWGPWLLAGIFAVYASQWLIVIGFLPKLMTEMGGSVWNVAIASAWVALVNVIGNVFSGVILEKQQKWQDNAISAPSVWKLWLHNPAQVIVLGFLGMMVGGFIAFVELSGVLLPVWVKWLGFVGFSAFGGLVPATLFACINHLAPHKDTVSITGGMMQQGSAFGQFWGPLVSAWLASVAHTWKYTWVIVFLCSALGIYMAKIMSRRFFK